MRTPTGICIAAYTSSCRTAKVENSEAPMPNRSEASVAATPSEVRWNTATT